MSKPKEPEFWTILKSPPKDAFEEVLDRILYNEYDSDEDLRKDYDLIDRIMRDE